MKRALAAVITGIFIAGVVAGVSAGATHGSAKANIRIQGTVPSKLDYRILQSPAAFTISKNDVKRGIKDVTAPTALWVKTNDKNGYVIAIAVTGLMNGGKQVFTSMVVKVDHSSVKILPDSTGEIHIPYRSPSDQRRLSYSIILAPNTPVGSYPWPAHVWVYPM